MLDDAKILNYVSQELSQASGGYGDSIEAEREAALGTYLGQPMGNEVAGRSSIVSTDVADAIEWIMPEIIKAFTQNNEVVVFDAEFDGDEDQAELESHFVYDILMKQNNGFLVLHQAVKDALMQKNGFVKVTYEENYVDQFSSYTGLTEVEYNILISEPGVDIISSETEIIDNIPIFSCKINKKKNKSKICVVAVPPEEFRVNAMHNSIDLSGARFTAHVTTKTRSDLISEGFDEDIINSIAADKIPLNDKYRFSMEGESTFSDEGSLDPSLEQIEVSECYMRMDIDEDGIAELVKVICVGGTEQVPEYVLSVEEIDSIPFISFTAILMSHKLMGLSIYDRLKQIQEQKTTLWRNLFDNMYLQNNQRTIVVENQVNLDDLLISRPGGIIRVKNKDAVIPYVTPALPSDSYKMMDYLDQVRAGRSGVSPEGPVQENMIGDRVGSEGIEKMLSQKEELVGLMIRVIAETAIKPLCYMIRELAIKHQDVVSEYRFRGNWVKVNPAKWQDRSRTTVRVGTGSGNRKEQLNAISFILQFQEKILMQPGQAMIKEDQVFQAINDFAKFAGMPGARRYFIDPKSKEGQEHKAFVSQQMKEQEQNAEAKDLMVLKFQGQIANAEKQKADVAGLNATLKGRNEELQLMLMKQQMQSDSVSKLLEQKLAKAEAVIKEIGDGNELAFKYWDREEFYKLEREKLKKEGSDKK
jgi:hypothetical protein